MQDKVQIRNWIAQTKKNTANKMRKSFDLLSWEAIIYLIFGDSKNVNFTLKIKLQHLIPTS